MGIFNKLREPIFLKETSSAQRQLEQLQAISGMQLPGDLKNQLDREMKLVSLGIQGEKAIEFELRNSHIPMYVLHDLYLEYNSLSAQIDYLVITRGCNFVIECKNLYGDVEINSKGDFIRNVNFGGRPQKEGIYSPITQNRRHLEIIKQMRGQEKGIFAKGAFEKNFFDIYRSVIVLANPKTILNDRYAKVEIKSQVIRADALIEYIRQANANTAGSSDKQMEELANYFLGIHIERNIDYAEKYTSNFITDPAQTIKEKPEPQSNQTISVPCCPKCGAIMVLRTAKRGSNAGETFWGCSQYPKCHTTILPDLLISDNKTSDKVPNTTDPALTLTATCSTKELEHKFHDEMLRCCQIIKDNGYNPKVFDSMIKKTGGYMTAKKLIRPEPSHGFQKLASMGLLKYSMEALVILPEYASLFTERERDICKNLLETYDYT